MHVTVEVVVGVVFLCIGGAAGGISNTLILRMVDEINRTRERDNFISHYWWHPGKYWMVTREFCVWRIVQPLLRSS